MTQETVVVPDIGGSEAAEVVEILISPGDQVVVDQGLIVLESDKASMEIPATIAGTVVEVLAKEGQELGEGAPVAVIETAQAAETPAASSEPSGDTAQAGSEDESQDGSEDSQAKVESPSAAEPQSDAASAESESLLAVAVPDIGTEDPVDLIELSVAEGDTVNEGDTLVVLESDKASMEVPSPASGIVTQIVVSEGQSVRQDDALMSLRVVAGAGEATAASNRSESSGTAPSPAPVDSPASPTLSPTPSPTKASTTAPKTPESEPAKNDDTATAANVYAGPAVRRLAREFGVPLAKVKATGPRGRIVKEDLHEYVQRALKVGASEASGAGLPVIPEVDFSAFGPVEVKERSKIDRVTAANMQRSWLNVPHVTQFDDADITELETFRASLKDEAKRRGTRITPMPFILKACAVALRRHPKLNASLSDGGTTLTFKQFVHIGIAVDTPAGLMVPVVRDVDKKTIWELSDEVLSLAERARERKLKPKEMQGGGFSVSSLGAIGGRGFTPIVNAPEVGILGVGKSSTQPVWDGAAFQPRLQLPLSLSYDHRVVNGGDAGRFLTELCGLLGDLRKQLL